MLYRTCTTISSVDLAQCGISFAKDWVSVKCGTNIFMKYERLAFSYNVLHSRGVYLYIVADINLIIAPDKILLHCRI